MSEPDRHWLWLGVNRVASAPRVWLKLMLAPCRQEGRRDAPWSPECSTVNCLKSLWLNPAFCCSFMSRNASWIYEFLTRGRRMAIWRGRRDSQKSSLYSLAAKKLLPVYQMSGYSTVIQTCSLKLLHDVYSLKQWKIANWLIFEPYKFKYFASLQK